MPMINSEDAQYLRTQFERELVHPVTLQVFTQGTSRIVTPAALQMAQECRFCEETRALIEELGALSDKIQVEVYDFLGDAEKARMMQVDKIPAIAVVGEKDYGIRFFGIPAGYEFAALLDDILAVSKRQSSLSSETLEALKTLQKDVHIQVFVTPT